MSKDLKPGIVKYLVLYFIVTQRLTENAWLIIAKQLKSQISPFLWERFSVPQLFVHPSLYPPFSWALPLAHHLTNAKSAKLSFCSKCSSCSHLDDKGLFKVT